MTTPKEALELKPCPFCGGTNTSAADTGVHWVACNSCDAEGPIRDTGHEAIAAWNTRTASLQGEDAVERVARRHNLLVIARESGGKEFGPNTWNISFTDETWQAFTHAILATGLVPDEAAIRADEREKCAKVAEAECYATTGRQIATAIRSNGRGA